MCDSACAYVPRRYKYFFIIIAKETVSFIVTPTLVLHTNYISQPFCLFWKCGKKTLASNCLNLLIYACLIINNILIPHSFMICGFIADWLLKQSPRVDLIEIVREWRKDRHTETHVQRKAEIKWSGLHGNWEWLLPRVEQGGRVLTSTQRDKVYVYRSAKTGLPMFSQSSL